MADIELDKKETELWNEIGSRGDAYRRAVRDRAAEQVRVSGKMTEIIADKSGMVDALEPGDPDPESSPAGRSPAGVTPSTRP